MSTDTVTPRAVRKPAFDVDVFRSFEHKIEIKAYSLTYVYPPTARLH